MSFPAPTEKQARILWLSVTALAIGILLALLGFLLWAFGWLINRLSAVLLPLAIAGILAYLFDPVVDFFQRKRVPRTRAIFLVFFLAVMLLLGLVGTVVPRLVVEAENLIRNFPVYTARLKVKVETFVQQPPLGIRIPERWLWWKRSTNSLLLSNAPPAALDTNQATHVLQLSVPATNTATNLVFSSDLSNLPPVEEPVAAAPASRPGVWSSDATRKILDWSARAVPRVGRWILDQMSLVASWVGLLIGLALVPVYTFYFLLEKKGIKRNWTDYLPIQESRVKDEAVFVLRSINYYLILFFRGQVLVAFCDGVLLTFGFLAIGLDFAVLLGVFAGLLSIVPFLGVVLSLIPALILAAVQFGDWLHPVLIVVIFSLVQMAEGLVISPKIMGDRVGLHPLTIIVAVMIGTTLLGGIIGGILAIPLTAALRVLMFRYVWVNRAGPETGIPDPDNLPVKPSTAGR